MTSTVNRIPPKTEIKPNRIRTTTGLVVPSTSRIKAPRVTSRLSNNPTTTTIPSLNSRSSSVVSSATTASKAPLRSRIIAPTVTGGAHVRPIPESNLVRKGLAKFSNPIECQRQFQILSEKIKTLNELVETKDTKLGKLREQLEQSLNYGVGYAIVVQYFAKKLKLDCDVDLVNECENLKRRIQQLEVSENEYEHRLESIVSDYKNHLQVEHDLRAKIECEIEKKCIAHSEEVENLNQTHKTLLEDLENEHSVVRTRLEERVETLELELKGKCKELADLRQEHEDLTNDFNKLEESLTKDKDARVKYAQEKISQLQKDVDSLNSVLEMRLERIHVLERDSLMLSEIQKDLIHSQDANKALKQQTESLNAALEKKRTQLETLIVEHEKLSQDLKRERKERRRMTMKTEELEYALNESCATESNSVLNSSVRDIEGADHLV